MFYRRKIILALLQLFEGRLDKIRLQKLLFLFTLRQPKAEYDFVPYKFGCYSYSANADLVTMVAKGILKESKKDFVKLDKTDYLNLIKEDDLRGLRQVKAEFGGMRTTSLIRHTYLTYPFYAIKSAIAAEVLNKHELKKVEESKPKSDETILFTIGYEGISLEKYLVRLLVNDVKVLVDVRNNPLSMKYGFSKSQLRRCCESLGMEYVHIPALGIQSEKRRVLKTQADYDRLFTVYRKENLVSTKQEQVDILNLLQQNKRIALTCFEANICQCHRKHLAESIERLPGFEYQVSHI